VEIVAQEGTYLLLQYKQLKRNTWTSTRKGWKRGQNGHQGAGTMMKIGMKTPSEKIWLRYSYINITKMSCQYMRNISNRNKKHYRVHLLSNARLFFGTWMTGTTQSVSREMGGDTSTNQTVGIWNLPFKKELFRWNLESQFERTI
jgi:hypothetical protein